MDDLKTRLITARDDDHERGCQMRFALCSCGYDDATAKAVGDALTRIEALEAEVARLREANGILEDGLQEVGDDYPGSSCQQWCQNQVKAARQALKGPTDAD